MLPSSVCFGEFHWLDGILALQHKVWKSSLFFSFMNLFGLMPAACGRVLNGRPWPAAMETRPFEGFFGLSLPPALKMTKMTGR